MKKKQKKSKKKRKAFKTAKSNKFRRKGKKTKRVVKRFKKNLTDNLNITARSRWPLDENAPYMKGPGLKL